MNNICAIYARYSSLDIERDGNPRSLSNQIEILTEYANNNHYIIYKIYSDYHESGKTFDRPGVMELLNDAKENKFKTIIVKDLSRFGRNYREIDKLLFEEFPKLNIRLISVNESLDSSKDNDSLPISVKNVMNDLYIRDLSRKIRKSKSILIEKKSLASFHYGYILKDKRFVIYEDESKVVKKVFNDFNEGKSLNEIANDLKNNKILAPFYSLLIKRGQENKLKEYSDDKLYKWNRLKIKEILNDDFFIGIATNAKSSVKSTDKRNIIIENDHEAIIDKDFFNNLDRSRIRRDNMEVVRSNLRHMIYCKKCLARYLNDTKKSNIYPTVIDDKEVYHDELCKKNYPTNLMNERIYDELIRKYEYIKANKDSFINKILFDLSSDDGKAVDILNKKKDFENKITKVFKNYMAGEITDNAYKTVVKEYNDEIIKCDNYLKMIKFDTAKYQEVTNRVNRFINLFYESENRLEPIKENVSRVLYDPRNGDLNIILKLEDEFNVSYNKLENLVIPEEYRREDFNLDEMCYEIIKKEPHITARKLLYEVRKTWEGFSLFGLRKALWRLVSAKRIRFEGKNVGSNIDGYVINEYKDEFDYHGMILNATAKKAYKLLYDKPTMGYSELAEKLDKSMSNVRGIILEIRHQGGFEYEPFISVDKTEGLDYSILKGIYRIPEQEIKEYIALNPKTTRKELSEKYNITEAQARRILERVRKK